MLLFQIEYNTTGDQGIVHFFCDKVTFPSPSTAHGTFTPAVKAVIAVPLMAIFASGRICAAARAGGEALLLVTLSHALKIPIWRWA